MQKVKQEVLPIDIVHVAIVRVSPVRRPWIDEHKRIASVHKAGLALYYGRALDNERVASSEVRAEPVVRDMATLAGRPRVSSILSGHLLPFLRLLARLFLVLFLLLLVLLLGLGLILPRLHLV